MRELKVKVKVEGQGEKVRFPGHRAGKPGFKLKTATKVTSVNTVIQRSNVHNHVALPCRGVSLDFLLSLSGSVFLPFFSLQSHQ